jgi:hypothetical protein
MVGALGGTGLERLRHLRGDTEEMIECLARLVSVESPSADPKATRLCAALLTDLSSALLGREPEHLQIKGRTHLRWRFGIRSHVLLLGHFDTVWPVGTLEGWPFSSDSEVAPADVASSVSTWRREERAVIEQARRLLDELTDAGIDFREVTDVVLERDGVEGSRSRSRSSCRALK